VFIPEQCQQSICGVDIRVERSENWVSGSGLVSGCGKSRWSGAEHGAAGHGVGMEQRVGLTELGLSSERIFRRSCSTRHSCSAHMLWFIHCVEKKVAHMIFGHNICECRPIFKISSLTDS